MAGRTREEHVVRDIRECAKHGRTDFVRAVVNDGKSIVFRCMKCESERNSEYYYRVKNGGPVRNYKAPSDEKDKLICETCHMQKPLSGICDNCD